MRHARHRPDARLVRIGRVLVVTGLGLATVALVDADQLRGWVLATERPSDLTLLTLLGLLTLGAVQPRRHPDDRPERGPLRDYWQTEGDWGRHHYPNDPEQF